MKKCFVILPFWGIEKISPEVIINKMCSNVLCVCVCMFVFTKLVTSNLHEVMAVSTNACT